MKEQIPEILAYINAHLDEEIILQEVAGYFGYESSYFSRRFKELAGFSLSDYISSRRIEMAKGHLLANSSIQKSQVLSGYASTGSFYRLFKEKTGDSPKGFSKEKGFIYHTLKEFETEGEKPVYHSTGKTGHSAMVQVDLPTKFRKGLVFIGLFHRRIPNHMPVAATVSPQWKKPLVLKNIPTGSYYLLSMAIEASYNPLHYFRYDKALRGEYGAKLDFPRAEGILPIRLREPLPEDPPIVYNFAKLLRKYTK